MVARTPSHLSARHSRRAGVAATSALLIAAVLASAPIESAVAAEQEFEQPTSSGNMNTSSGSASDLGAALAKADDSEKAVEVKSLRTETETFFANPDGTVRRDVAQAPIRAENAEGDLVGINTELVEEGDRLAPVATTGNVSFSSDGEGAAATYEPAKNQAVSLSFGQDIGDPQVDGSIATYPVEGQPDQSVQVYARGDGFASRVVLDKAPEPDPASTSAAQAADEPTGNPSAPAPQAAEEPVDPAVTQEPSPPATEESDDSQVTFEFDVDVKGLTPSLKDGVLSFADSGGKIVAQSSPLLMWDSRVDVAGDPAEKLPVDADLRRDADGGYTLVLRPSMAFLTSPDTVYPVVVDPDVSAYLNGDTYYYSNQSSTPLRGQEPTLKIGSDDGSRRFQALLQWNYKSFLGATVTKADLKLYQYFSGASSCSNATMRLYPTTETAINTWWGNKPPVTEDARFSSSKAFNHGGSASCPGASETINVTPMVNAWASGQSQFYDYKDPRGRQGIQIQAADEYSQGGRKWFCSQDPDSTHDHCDRASRVPTLTITYQPEVGSQSWYSMTDHTLNDRSSISVNNKNGNAVIAASDVSINGFGVDLSVDRTYNSQSEDVSSVGRGWSLGVGPDVWLERKSEFRYDFHAPGGTVLGSFIRKSALSTSANYRKFDTPVGGVGADLTEEKDNNNNYFFKLKFRGNRTSYMFRDNSPDDHAYLTEIVDPSANDLVVTYSGNYTSANKPKMSSISASGQTVNVTYGGSGQYVTQLSHAFASGDGANSPPTTRTWNYGYDGDGYLTQYTDAEGKSTSYGYKAMTAASKVVDKITAAVNSGGSAPTTEIAYDYKASLEINQVTQVAYRYGSGQNDLYKYTYEYTVGDAQRPTDCKGNGSYFTIVADPNFRPESDPKPNRSLTTYCYRSRNDFADGSKTWVYDAKGNGKSIDYTADNGPMNVTNPSGEGNVEGGSTVAKYSDDLADQLSSVTEPDSGTDDKATTAFEYGSASSNGGAYQPIASKDPSGNCNRFGYDSKGRTTDAFTGISITPTSTSTQELLQTTSTCGPSGGSDVRRFHREYNSNGSVSRSWDGNAKSATPDPQGEPALEDQTVYTYWSGNDTGYVTGTAGQLKSIRKPGGSCAATVAAGRSLCTSYTYDGASRVKTITNGNAITTTYARDKMDRTVAVFFGGATSCDVTATNCLQYTYDAEGNLTSRREALGRVTTFTHDQLNRLVNTKVSEGVLLPTVAEEQGSAYDGTGNLTAYTQNIANLSDEVTYRYNIANRLEAVTDASGTIDIETDKDGRTSRIKFPRPTGFHGMEVDYDFTNTGKPKSMTIKKVDGASLATFAYNYKFDPFKGTVYEGLLEIESPQMRDRDVTGSSSVDNLKTSVDYSYNNENRLTGADAASGTDYSYEYDKVGNISKDQGASTTYYGYSLAGELCWQGPSSGAPEQKLSTVCATGASGSTDITHDNAGNSTGTSSSPIAYNNRDQVSTIGGTDMTYEDLGNDLRTTTGATRTVTGPTGITATKAGSVVTFYTRDTQGTILSSHSSGLVRNYVTEYNSSVAALYNPSGSIVGSYRYSPYGATTVNAESGGTTAGNNRFRYISGYQDLNSSGGDGYYKLGSRYYDARGHFTQPDVIAGTISDPKTLTAYNYSGGDPINNADPSGQSLVEAAKFGTKLLGKATKALDVAQGIAKLAEGDYRGAAAIGIGLVTGTAVGVICSPLAVTGIGAIGCAGAASGAGLLASSSVEGKVG